MRKPMYSLWLVPILVGMMLVLPVSASASRPAYCTGSVQYNRRTCYGYFTGADAYNGNVSVDSIIKNGGSSLLGVKNASDFTSLINRLLFVGGKDEIGAAFIVDTMLGKSGTDFSSINGGVLYARANFNTWSSLVGDYDQNVRGSVNWNADNTPTSFIAPFQDSARSLLGASNDDIFYMKQLGESHPVITFLNSDGTTYKIKKESGGLIGASHPLRLKYIPIYPTITNQQIEQAQNGVAAEGTIKSFNGTAMGFVANGSNQPVNLMITTSTTYVRGVNNVSGKASDLKAGSRVIVFYDQKTDNVTKVAYGL